MLIGKALDFTTKWATGPAYDPNVKVIAIDPDELLVARAPDKEKGERLLEGCVADTAERGARLDSASQKGATRRQLARGGPRRLIDSRPATWASVMSRRRPAGCTPPRCSAPCGRTSNAIPARS